MGRISTVADLRRHIPEPSELAGKKILDHLDDQAIAFIDSSPFAILATYGVAGFELSPKGDAPGFVRVLDERTLLIPERRGNQLALGLQNLLTDDRVGLMLLRPNASEVLRVSGRAELLDDAELCRQLSARGQAAVLVTRISVERAFFHCARSVLRAGLWAPESWPAPMRVSFGRIYAAAMGNDALQAAIDSTAENYRQDL